MDRFYIKFELDWQENKAKEFGFSGAQWKENLLSDLREENALCIWKGQIGQGVKNQEWYVQGLHIWIVCKVDGMRSDSLFCLRILSAQSVPQQLRGNGFKLPARWEVGTIASKRASHDEEPLESRLERLYSEAQRQGIVQIPKQRKTANAEAVNSQDNSSPFSVLRDFKPKIGRSSGAITGESALPLALTEHTQETISVKGKVSNPGNNVESQQSSILSEVSIWSQGTLELTDDSVSSIKSNVEHNELTHSSHEATLILKDIGTWDELALRAIWYTTPTLKDIISSDNPLAARKQKITLLEAEIAKLREALEEIPDDRVVLDAQELQRNLLAVGRNLPAKFPSIIAVDNPKNLLCILNALSSELLPRIPLWILGGLQSDEERVSFVLGNKTTQVALLEALDWIEKKFAGAPPLGLELISDPGPNGSTQDRLEAAWQKEEDERCLRQEFPEGVIRVLERHSGEAREMLKVSLRKWQKHLHPNAFLELIEIHANKEAIELSTDLIDTLDLDDIKTLNEISDWGRAKKYLCMPREVNENRAVESSKTVVRSAGQLLRIDHVVTDQKGSVFAAPVWIPEPDRNSTFVLLDIPIRFIADAPIPNVIKIRVLSNGTSNVPKDSLLDVGMMVRDGKDAWMEWSLSEQAERWDRQDSGQVFREESISIPVTLGFANELRTRRQRALTVEFISGSVRSALRFERFIHTQFSLGSGAGQGDETATQLIERHALGPQEDHQKLEGLIEEGRHAFMVVAPRRFGKTTLFHHLADRARRSSHEIVEVTLQRDLSAEQGAVCVWEKIRESLEMKYKSAPALGSILPKKLEDEEAWASVRTFVKEKGAQVLHLFIDEAQVLVPRSGGERWGNVFKNFVETHLARPKDGHCYVQVAMFGTVDLSVRVGQNCRDFLLMYGTEHHVFGEKSLARYLRAVSQEAIVSSKRARELMSRWTNNLRTLYALLERTRAYLRNKKRLFLLDLDVEHCIHELLSPDNPQSAELWSYVRAELSHRDEWEPVDAFPLAVAWAQTDDERMAPVKHLEQSTRWLEQVLSKSGTNAAIVQERLEVCLRDLKARGVLRDDGSFWRPVLREMIKRKPGLLEEDPASYHALLRLTVDSVSCPDVLQPKDEGGQARVHMVRTGTHTLAYRICSLDTQDERRRFARTCAALRTLRERHTRLEGDRYLPRVSKAGFAEDDPNLGIIVYDWIEGERMDRYSSDISLELRIHIALQVAHAVQALHAREVIHCDIAPRNILIDSQMNATLIDFGLARRADSTSHTQLGSDQYKAPELLETFPNFGKDVDIFALGVLLNDGVEKNQMADDMNAYICQMMQRNPSERPLISDVVRRLQDWSTFDVLLKEKRGKVDDIILKTPDWLWEELMNGANLIASSLAGRRRWDRQLAMESAFLLNNIFARIVHQKLGIEASILADLCIGEELSLSRVGDLLTKRILATNYPHWMSSDVKAIGHLRNALAHPTDREAKLNAAFKVLGAPASASFEIFRKSVQVVANSLDKLLNPEGTCISEYVQLLL